MSELQGETTGAHATTRLLLGGVLVLLCVGLVWSFRTEWAKDQGTRHLTFVVREGLRLRMEFSAGQSGVRTVTLSVPPPGPHTLSGAGQSRGDVLATLDWRLAVQGTEDRKSGSAEVERPEAPDRPAGTYVCSLENDEPTEYAFDGVLHHVHPDLEGRPGHISVKGPPHAAYRRWFALGILLFVACVAATLMASGLLSLRRSAH